MQKAGLKKGGAMNLLIGDSHVHYAFSEIDKISTKDVTERLRLVETFDWTSLSYWINGISIFSVSRNLDSDMSLSNIDLYKYTNMFLIFGTNDALIYRENRQSWEECIPYYLESIEKIRIKYGIKKAYVICPFYIKNLDNIDCWDSLRYKLNSYDDMNHIIKDIKENIILESQQYENINCIDMSNLFQTEEELFATEYSLDGVHFNNQGQKIFFNKIYEGISND